MISFHQILSLNKYFIAFENKSFNILVLIRKKDFSYNIFHRWYLFWNTISKNIEKFHENVDYLINSILNRRHKCNYANIYA